MNRAEKSELAQSLKDQFSRAKLAVFADYKGLTATQADDLRRLLRTHQAQVSVLKNNIARLAVKGSTLGSDTEALLDQTVGPTMVAFAYGDPAAVAKAVHKFSQDNEAFKLKDSLLGKQRISTQEVEELAKLPGREVLLAKLLGSLNAPASNFVGVLAAVPRSLLNVLKAIEAKKAEQA